MAIISHDNEFIFVHIPKTAGTSINEALTREPTITSQKIKRKLKHLPSLINPNQPTHPKLITPKVEKHAKAIKIKQKVGNTLWDNYFTFSFIRNPWDLMVSSYKWWLQKAHMWPHLAQDIKYIKNMDGFKTFLKSPYGTNMINEHQGTIMDWLTDEKDTVIVDYVGKFETLEKDFRKICKKLAINEPALPRINVTNRYDYRNYYDYESRQWITERFSKTIEQFGYTF